MSLLDALEARQLRGFLICGTVPTFSLAATCKRQALALLGRNGAAAVELNDQYPVDKRTVEARPIKDAKSQASAPLMPGKAGRGLTESGTGDI